MKILKHFTIYWLPTLVWGLIIFSFSARPTIQTFEIRWGDFIVKKTAHFVEYFILAILLFRTLKNSGVGKEKAIIYAVSLCIIYAASDEFHQSFTPGRDPRLRDVIIDTIGASVAGYVLWKLLHKMPKTLKTLAKNLDLV